MNVANITDERLRSLTTEAHNCLIIRHNGALDTLYDSLKQCGVGSLDGAQEVAVVWVYFRREYGLIDIVITPANLMWFYNNI